MINKRREERVAAALPIFLADATGVTCDVSASGMFFETNVSLAVGESIDFRVEFDAPSGKMMLKCMGEIIRTERRDDRIGVAIRIADSTLGLARLNPAAATHV